MKLSFGKTIGEESKREIKDSEEQGTIKRLESIFKAEMKKGWKPRTDYVGFLPGIKIVEKKQQPKRQFIDLSGFDKTVKQAISVVSESSKSLEADIWKDFTKNEFYLICLTYLVRRMESCQKATGGQALSREFQVDYPFGMHIPRTIAHYCENLIPCQYGKQMRTVYPGMRYPLLIKDKTKKKYFLEYEKRDYTGENGIGWHSMRSRWAAIWQKMNPNGIDKINRGWAFGNLSEIFKRYTKWIGSVQNILNGFLVPVSQKTETLGVEEREPAWVILTTSSSKKLWSGNKRDRDCEVGSRDYLDENVIAVHQTEDPNEIDIVMAKLFQYTTENSIIYTSLRSGKLRGHRWTNFRSFLNTFRKYDRNLAHYTLINRRTKHDSGMMEKLREILLKRKDAYAVL
jgi:hypothetical protein